MMSSLLKEPLLHFVVIGLVLFAIYNQVGDSEPREGYISLSRPDITLLADAWQRRWKRPPSPRKLQELIEARVREEVLYREALSLGLGRDDPAVRRRLSQKMTFLFEDLTELPIPRDEQLAALLASEPHLFQRPARYRLRHLFFSRDRRGAATQDDARAALARLQRGEDVTGDRFVHALTFGNLTEDDIRRQLGRAFVEQLNALPIQSWQGPLDSTFGVHLIFVEHKQYRQLPQLDAVRDEVMTTWQARERQRLNDNAYHQLRRRYTVNVDWDFDVESELL